MILWRLEYLHNFRDPYKYIPMEDLRILSFFGDPLRKVRIVLEILKLMGIS